MKLVISCLFSFLLAAAIASPVSLADMHQHFSIIPYVSALLILLAVSRTPASIKVPQPNGTVRQVGPPRYFNPGAGFIR